MTPGPRPGGADAAPASAHTVVDHALRRARTTPNDVAVRFAAGDRWAPITWGQLGQASRRVSAFLLSRGVAAGERVAIWAPARPEWLIADLAILELGAVSVPVPHGASAERAGAILADCGARVAVVEAGAAFDELLAGAGLPRPLEHVVLLGGAAGEHAGGGEVVAWEAALHEGEVPGRAREAELNERAAAIDAADDATVVYALGETPPRSAALSHGDLVAAVAEMAAFLGPEADDRIAVAGSLAEVGERVHSELRAVVHGGTLWFTGEGEPFGERFASVRPSTVWAPAAAWETLAQRIGDRGRPVAGRRGALRWAVRVGEHAAAAGAAGREPRGLLRLRHRLADGAVLTGVRGVLGMDGARALLSGGAPSDEALRLCRALGLPIVEMTAMGQG